MTQRVRNGFIVSTIALALLSLLWFRLDASALKNSLTEKLSVYAESTSMQAETSSLTFMHGIGLRLNQVKLDHPSIQITAKHINISIRLLPLLLGKFEINELDMHDAVFKLKSDSLALSAASISNLPLERIHLIRSRIESVDGIALLNNIKLELRGIGTEHETLWELNAQDEHQEVSGHGRILFHQGQLDSSFGKLKLANMPVTKLHSLVPARLLTWIEGEGNKLSGSLTMDMSNHQRWALFGEMMLENEFTHLAAKLRGKLNHPMDGKLVWKDSFIHLDKKAVIAIAGSCEQNECNTTLDAKNIAIERWHPFIPGSITFHRNISASTHLLASMQWNDEIWQGTAALKLKKASFLHNDKNIALPDLNFDISELSSHATTWSAKSAITSANISGVINVESNQESSGEKNMEITTDNADSKLWQPLANLLLSSLKLEPDLEAHGTIQGSVHLHQHNKRKKLELDVDATSTEINYSPWLKKAAEVEATCQANIQFSDARPYAINMSKCQLGASSIAQLNWSKKKERQKLVIDKLKLNLDSLHKHSVALPEAVKNFSGDLTGSGKTSWKNSEHWTKTMHGAWLLRNIGPQTWQADADIAVKKGLFSSKKMSIKGIYGQAELKGSFHFAKKRGDIDIISSSIDWDRYPTLTSYWHDISLRGKLKKTELILLNNNWQNIHSNYTFSQGTLSLKKLQGRVADGSISSDQLALSPGPNGLKIKGNLRGKKIQLDQLQGLNEWIQADMRGALHANIKLNGLISPSSTLPWSKNWQLSNGDLLIYSGDWQQHQQAESLTEQLGISTPILEEHYAFKKLEFRFKIRENKTDINGITLIRHKQTYRGKSSITPDLQISGKVQNRADKTYYLMNSHLPQIHWQAQ